MVDVGGGSALFDPTGSELFYVTDAGLRRSTTTSPSPTTLTSSAEAQTPLALSPDGQQLLVMNASNQLWTVATSAPSTPLTISAGAGYTTWANDSFTADSQYVLFYTDYQGSFEPDGTLNAVPLDGGAGTSLVGKHGSFAISGSLVAVADVSSPTASAGNVNLVDVAGAQPTRLLAPGAWVTSGDPCGWLATPDRKYIVYSRSQEGLYVVPTQ
jgi:hypothetical protein